MLHGSWFRAEGLGFRFGVQGQHLAVHPIRPVSMSKLSPVTCDSGFRFLLSRFDISFLGFSALKLEPKR